MGEDVNYLELNRKAWNDKTKVHITAPFYDVAGFVKGQSSLKAIELSLLGDITGKKILHLQCHFGLDTLSLARMGARLTGVDLSDVAINEALKLSEQTGLEARFICSDVYGLSGLLNEKFDIVFTSYGTIGWLPDMKRWAEIVSHFLKPAGKFVFVEFHPVVWMFDQEFASVGYSYFNDTPIVETEQGTYADPAADLLHTMVTWNHPISEVVNSLTVAGLNILSLNEYDYSPFDCFRNTEEFAPGQFRIGHLGNKIPMVYAIVASKER